MSTEPKPEGSGSDLVPMLPKLEEKYEEEEGVLEEEGIKRVGSKFLLKEQKKNLEKKMKLQKLVTKISKMTILKNEALKKMRELNVVVDEVQIVEDGVPESPNTASTSVGVNAEKNGSTDGKESKIAKTKKILAHVTLTAIAQL